MTTHHKSATLAIRELGIAHLRLSLAARERARVRACGGWHRPYHTPAELQDLEQVRDDLLHRAISAVEAAGPDVWGPRLTAPRDGVPWAAQEHWAARVVMRLRWPTDWAPPTRHALVAQWERYYRSRRREAQG